MDDNINIIDLIKKYPKWGKEFLNINPEFNKFIKKE